MSLDVEQLLNILKEECDLKEFQVYYTDIYVHAIKQRYDELYPQLYETQQKFARIFKQCGFFVKRVKEQGYNRHSKEQKFLYKLMSSLQSLRDRLTYLLTVGKEEMEKEMHNQDSCDFGQQNSPEQKDQLMDQVVDHPADAPINLGRSQHDLKRKRKHFRKNRGLRLYFLSISFLSFFTIELFFFRNYDYIRRTKVRIEEMFAFSLYDFFLTRVVMFLLIFNFRCSDFLCIEFYFLLFRNYFFYFSGKCKRFIALGLLNLFRSKDNLVGLKIILFPHGVLLHTLTALCMVTP